MLKLGLIVGTGLGTVLGTALGTGVGVALYRKIKTLWSPATKADTTNTEDTGPEDLQTDDLQDKIVSITPTPLVPSAPFDSEISTGNSSTDEKPKIQLVLVVVVPEQSTGNDAKDRSFETTGLTSIPMAPGGPVGSKDTLESKRFEISGHLKNSLKGEEEDHNLKVRYPRVPVWNAPKPYQSEKTLDVREDVRPNVKNDMYSFSKPERMMTDPQTVRPQNPSHWIKNRTLELEIRRLISKSKYNY